MYICNIIQQRKKAIIKINEAFSDGNFLLYVNNRNEKCSTTSTYVWLRSDGKLKERQQKTFVYIYIGTMMYINNVFLFYLKDSC